jgi:orotate phosphoribosyltransferase
MKPDDVLKCFLETGALLKGHFELRSKLHSDQYFQCALVLRYPDIAARLSKAVVATMQKALGPTLKVDAVIAPALGGLVVGHEVARALKVPFIFAEKQEGCLVLRRGFRIKPGMRFVVAEDVITRGGRVQETIDIVEKAGGKVAAIVVIVDRSGGNARFKVPAFSLLQMEPVTFEPGQCPLCAKDVPIDHPGS